MSCHERVSRAHRHRYQSPPPHSILSKVEFFPMERLVVGRNVAPNAISMHRVHNVHRRLYILKLFAYNNLTAFMHIL